MHGVYPSVTRRSVCVCHGRRRAGQGMWFRSPIWSKGWTPLRGSACDVGPTLTQRCADTTAVCGKVVPDAERSRRGHPPPPSNRTHPRGQSGVTNPRLDPGVAHRGAVWNISPGVAVTGYCLLNKHETLTRWWLNAGPGSTTLAQR